MGHNPGLSKNWEKPSAKLSSGSVASGREASGQCSRVDKKSFGSSSPSPPSRLVRLERKARRLETGRPARSGSQTSLSRLKPKVRQLTAYCIHVVHPDRPNVVAWSPQTVCVKPPTAFIEVS